VKKQFNDWNVSYSTISYFEDALKNHSKVADVYRAKDILFNIELTNGTQIKMLLVDEYTLGLAAVFRALREFGKLDYIVTAGNWNAYSPDAKEYGDEHGIGIFKGPEFLKALYLKNPKRFVSKDD